MARQPRLGWRACIPLSDSDNQARASLLRQKHLDRKSTRLNSSHLGISYAVFCLKKKKIKLTDAFDNDHESGNVRRITNAYSLPRRLLSIVSKYIMSRITCKATDSSDSHIVITL